MHEYRKAILEARSQVPTSRHWAAVGKKLGVSAEKAYQKWRYMRAHFTQYHQMTVLNDGVKPKKKWVPYRQLVKWMPKFNKE